MKKLFLFLFVCFMYTVGFAEGIGGGGGSGGDNHDTYSLLSSVCNVNAGGDDAYCITTDSFTLYASVSSPTNPFPNTYSWSLLSGPSAVSIVSPNALTTGILGPFSVGTYQFIFCAMCADSTTQCDTVNITVTANVTTAVITDLGGTPITADPLETCLSFNVLGNAPGAGEQNDWSFVNFDPYYSEVITSGFTNYTGSMIPYPNCFNQTIIYQISNGGCSSYDSLDVLFYRQATPVQITYPGNNSNLCGTQIGFYATYAGCTGISLWSVISTPVGAITPIIAYNGYSSTNITFGTSGHYSIAYSVDSSGPCPGGSDTIDIYVCISNPNGLGNYEYYYLCDTFPDSIYLHSNWDPTYEYSDWVGYVSGGANPLVFNHSPADTGATAVILDQNADYYAFCQSAVVGNCVDGQDTNICVAQKCVYYFKYVTFDLESDTVNLFCGGVQGFYPYQYVTTSGYSNNGGVNPLVVPVGSPIIVNNYYYYGSYFDLQLPGQYIFQFYSGVGTPCPDTTLLYVNVSSLENPSAGTSVVDSICNIDTITVVGSLPINQYTGLVDPNAVVLWQQISGPSTLNFINPANSQLVNLTGFVPGTYQMVYSFSLDPTCYLADTMTITLYPCDTIDPPLDSCVSLVNDSVWCDGSGYYMHFCVRNNSGNSWNLNSFQLVTPPGVTINSISQPAGSGFVNLAPQYYYYHNLPSTAPGSTLCDFVVQVSGVSAGSNVCFYIIGHDEDTIPSANCCLDSNNVLCVQMPICDDTCGYITDSLYCVDGILYYSYTIHNIGNFSIDGFKLYMTPPVGGVVIANIFASIPPMGTYTGTPINLSSYGLTAGSTACFYANLYSFHMLGGVPCIDTSCLTAENCHTVPNCEDCCGYWGTNSYTSYGLGGFPISRIMHCGDAIPYNCPRLDNMYSFQYYCARPCATTFTANLLSPSNTVIWSGSNVGSVWSINGNTLPFTIDGVYQLVVYTYCGEHLCDSCIITIRKDCIEECVCGNWVRTYYQGYDGHGLPVSVPFSCGATIPYNCPPLNNVYSFEYQCSSTTCDPTYEATLTDALGNILWTGTYTGSVYNVSGLPITTNGTYYLSVVVYCNGVRCDRCDIRIPVECHFEECNCGNWVRTYYQGYDGHGLPISVPFRCGATIPYNCPPLNNVYSFEYQCSSTTCNPTYEATLTDALGNVLWTGTYTGSVYNVTGLPITTNGTYYLTVDVYCNGVRCDRCEIRIPVECHFEECNCGSWIKTYYQGYDRSGNPVSINFNCGDGIYYNCPPLNNIYSFQYRCSGVCNTYYEATLYDSDGNAIWTGNYTGSTYDVTGLPITTSGIYTLTVVVYCNGKKCDDCSIRIIAECHFDECTCGNWVRTYYQGYDGHGSPISVPFRCGATIPYNCPPLSNVYSFEYQCSSTTCNPTYEATLTDALGNIIWTGTYTGSIYNISGLPITTNGTYYLSVDVYCNGVRCDRCEIRIPVECHFVECNCGEWSQTYYLGYDGHGSPISVPFECGETIRYNCPPLSNMYTFNYRCSGTCYPTYEATLTDDLGNPIWTGTYTGAIYNVSGLPIMTNGNYTLTVVAFCGGIKCEKCEIIIRADCHFPDCCGEWHKNYVDDYSDPRAPFSRVFECGESVRVDCINTYHMLYNYVCKEECPTTYYTIMEAPDGSITTLTSVGSSLNYTQHFTQNGTYRLQVFVYCGGKLCSECVNYFDADCSEVKRLANPNSTNSTTNSDIIQVYPNPAADHLTISTLNESIKMIEILDLEGRIVYSSNILKDARNASIDLSTVSPGSYLIRINKTTQKKINIIR